MRKMALSFVVATLAGCGSGGAWSPSDPRTFDRAMFDESAIRQLPKEEQPYVMGHAIGVYLYGKTLPKYVEGHYLYRPGLSSPHADSAYDWEHVLIARSGGSDGNGGAIYDDVGEPIGEPADGTDDPNIGGGGVPSDDVGEGSGNDDGSDGDGDGSGGGGGHGDECGQINLQCGAFLDPAAQDARDMALLVDASRFADAGMTGSDLARFAQEFQRGMDQALAIPDLGELGTWSEVTYMKDDALAVGICAQ